MISFIKNLCIKVITFTFRFNSYEGKEYFKEHNNMMDKVRKLREGKYDNRIRIIILSVFIISLYIFSYFYMRPRYSDTNLKSAKSSVIEKINVSRYIVNKYELIESVKNVNIIETDEESYYMAYNSYNGEDYIYVSSSCFEEVEKNSFIHELNHLIDKKMKLKEDFDEYNLIDTCVSLSDYMDINYRCIRELNESGELDIYNIREVSNYISEYLYNFRDGGYFISRSEIYARVSTMKSNIVEEGLIFNNSYEVTKEDLEYIYKLSLVSMLTERKSQSYFGMDYMYLIPLIKDESQLIYY